MMRTTILSPSIATELCIRTESSFVAGVTSMIASFTVLNLFDNLPRLVFEGTAPYILVLQLNLILTWQMTKNEKISLHQNSLKRRDHRRFKLILVARFVTKRISWRMMKNQRPVNLWHPKTQQVLMMLKMLNSQIGKQLKYLCTDPSKTCFRRITVQCQKSCSSLAFR